MGYNPKKENKLNHKNDLNIVCPMRFTIPELGIECLQEKCAWWMIQQKACAINVGARKTIPKQLGDLLSNIVGVLRNEH